MAPKRREVEIDFSEIEEGMECLSINLSQELKLQSQYMKIEKDELVTKKAIVEQIGALISATFYDYELKVVGSTFTELGEKGCDLDLLLILAGHTVDFATGEVIKSVKDSLDPIEGRQIWKEQGHLPMNVHSITRKPYRKYFPLPPHAYCNYSTQQIVQLIGKLIPSDKFVVTPLDKAFVPIVRVFHRYTNTEIDLLVASTAPLQNSAYLSILTKFDSRFTELSFCIRAWVKAHKLEKRYNGFNSYACNLLLVRFLQYVATPAVLPTPEQIHSMHSACGDYFQINDVAFNWLNANEKFIENIWCSPNKQTLAELYSQFFKHYEGIDFFGKVIAQSKEEYLKPFSCTKILLDPYATLDDVVYPTTFVLCPIDKLRINNAARHVTFEKLNIFEECVNKTNHYFKSVGKADNGKLSELFKFTSKHDYKPETFQFEINDPKISRKMQKMSCKEFSENTDLHKTLVNWFFKVREFVEKDLSNYMRAYCDVVVDIYKEGIHVPVNFSGGLVYEVTLTFSQQIWYGRNQYKFTEGYLNGFAPIFQFPKGTEFPKGKLPDTVTISVAMYQKFTRCNVVMEVEKSSCKVNLSAISKLFKMKLTNLSLLPLVELEYDSVEHYQDTFKPLLEAEKIESEKRERSLQFRVRASFDGKLIVCRADQSFMVDRMRLGKNVSLWKGQNWVLGGTTKEIDPIGGTVVIETWYKHMATQYRDGLYILKCHSGTGSFDRISVALQTMKTSFSPSTLSIVLGREKPKRIDNVHQVINAPNMPKLNESQRNAIEHSLAHNFSIIQGPPGTGKTGTSTVLVYNLVRELKKTVLVCAPSNVAADNIACRMKESGLNVLRIYAYSREGVPTESSRRLDKFALHQILQTYPHLRDLKREMIENPTKQKIGIYDTEKEAIIDRLLDSVEVICTTCIAAFDKRLKKRKFDYVLIDEATQAMEPEVLIPLSLAERAILVGDHFQLGPTVMNQEALQAGLGLSFFERCVERGIVPIQLLLQYRMHPFLSAFPNKHFYNNVLRDAAMASKNVLLDNILPGYAGKPFIFIHATGRETRRGRSFVNYRESNEIEKFVGYLLRAGVKETSIGVITPYLSQKSCLHHKIIHSYVTKKFDINKIEVKTVDGYQGQEKDFVILSCVRSNHNGNVGFLNDRRRLNVALTRAKHGLFVIGNAELLAEDPSWEAMIRYLNDNKCIVSGRMGKFQNVKVNLPPIDVEL